MGVPIVAMAVPIVAMARRQGVGQNSSPVGRSRRCERAAGGVNKLQADHADSRSHAAMVSRLLEGCERTGDGHAPGARARPAEADHYASEGDGDVRRP